MTAAESDWEMLGIGVERATPLSRNGSARAFRLDLADGRTLKARLFPTARWAASVERLLRAPGARSLPRPIRRAGHVLVTEYIEGVPLDGWLPSVSREHVTRAAKQAGRLMAHLHAGGCPSGRPAAPARYREHLIAVTRRLVRASMLEPTEAHRLAGLVPPARARMGLTHGDICPENLIRTPSGRVRAIDEERLALRPLAFDLARAVNRWPLDPALERAFLAGYSAGTGDAREFVRWRAFWIGAALASSAGYRLSRNPETLGPTLAALRALAAAIA